jgi:uncharacterized protein YkvS
MILTLFLAVQPALVSFASSAATSPSTSEKPLVIVIVNSTIYKSVETSLNQYAIDVEDEGFSVNITETDQLQQKTAAGIRAYLQEAYSDGLVGAFLVGDIAEAWYRINDGILPTDIYYRDLDGSWIDVNGDGVFEQQSGNTAPEIWVGRLKASPIPGNETSLINNYFLKNHRYRAGLRVLPWWRALAYIDDDGIDWAEDVNSSLNQVYSDVTLVTDPAETTAQDYLNRIADPFGFQWVYLMSHGAFDYHTFMVNDQPVGGTVYPYQYRDIDPRVFFYTLFICSGTRYTEREYLAGTTVFTQNYGLVSIGSTDTIYSISFRKFFADLAERKAIGTAFQEWFIEQGNWQNQLKAGEDYRYLFYGLTIVGDPTLRLDNRPSVKIHDISVTDVTTSIVNASNTYSVIVNVTLKNYGDFDESFDVMIYEYNYQIARAQFSLHPKSYLIANITIKNPYRIIISNGTQTKLALTASFIPEEFNLGDNILYAYVEDAIIQPPELVIPNPVVACIVILSAAGAIAYGILRTITSDNPIPSFAVKGKQFFTRKLSMAVEKYRKSRQNVDQNL